MENLQKHIMRMFLRFIFMPNAYNEINSTSIIIIALYVPLSFFDYFLRLNINEAS